RARRLGAQAAQAAQAATALQAAGGAAATPSASPMRARRRRSRCSNCSRLACRAQVGWQAAALLQVATGRPETRGRAGTSGATRPASESSTHTRAQGPTMKWTWLGWIVFFFAWGFVIHGVGLVLHEVGGHALATTILGCEIDRINLTYFGH